MIAAWATTDRLGGRRRTGVSACMALQVEGVVEALAAERAKVSLDVRMTLCVSVEEPLQVELLQC